MRRLRALVSALVIGSASAFAADGPGTTGSAFLKIPVNARATALGGSFAAVSGDINAIDYNPAGLCGFTRTDVRATYIDYLEDSSLQAVSLGFPVAVRQAPVLEPLANAEFSQDRLSLGLQYRAFRSDDIARNSVGVKLQEFDIRDTLFNGSIAYPVLPRVAVGASAKYLSNKIQDRSASTYAFDAGVLLKLPQGWSVGAAIQNVGSGKALDQVADPLPSLVRGGIAYRLPYLLFVGDVAAGRDGVLRKSGGVEWILGSLFRLRAGASHDTTLQFAGGLGVQFSGPQKATSPVQRPPSSKTANNQPEKRKVSTITQQVVAQMTSRLLSKFKAPPPDEETPTIAILPLNSQDGAGHVVTELLIHEFVEKDVFGVVERAAIKQILDEQHLQQSGAIDTANAAEVGKILSTQLVLVGSVDQIDEKYAINTRIVRTGDGKILATDYAEIAVEDFTVRPRHSLGNEPTKSSSSRAGQAFSSIDIGLDYALASHITLGITHTLTLRILY